MYNITKEVLEESAPGTIMAHGVLHDGGSTSLADTGKFLPWVAVRGGAPDWTIYVQPVYSDELLYPKVWDQDLLKRVGDKLPKHMVEKLVDVTDEALKMYRK